MDQDRPAARRRRWSREEPLDFSPNPRRGLSLLVPPFLSVYELSRRRLEDIISELQPSEKHRDRQENLQENQQENLQENPQENLQRNLQERSRAGGAWGLVTAAAAALAGLVSAQLLGWWSSVVLLSLAVVGWWSSEVLWSRRRRSSDSAAQRRLRVAALREEFRAELEQLMAALEQLERRLKELRAQEDHHQNRRTLHQLQINLPDAKFNVNHLHLLLLRCCQGEEPGGGVTGGEERARTRAVHDTLTELDQFVGHLRWAESRYLETL